MTSIGLYKWIAALCYGFMAAEPPLNGS